MCIVCCQVEASASCWSFAQGIPSECCLSESDREASIMRRPWPTRSCRSIKKILRTLYLREQGYEDVIFFGAQRGPRAKKVWETLV